MRDARQDRAVIFVREWASVGELSRYRRVRGGRGRKFTFSRQRVQVVAFKFSAFPVAFLTSLTVRLG